MPLVPVFSTLFVRESPKTFWRGGRAIKMLPLHGSSPRASVGWRRRRPEGAAHPEVPGAGWASGSVKALCDADELPEWYAPMPYVRTRYRVGYGACDCVLSLVGEVHNETCNAWSHGLGAAFFGRLSLRRGRALPGFADPERRADEAFVLCFTVCATAALFCSAAYHTLRPVGSVAARRWLRADKVGVAAMIAGSMAPGVWLGFRCAAPAARLGWLAAAVVVFIVGAALSLGALSEARQPAAFAALVASGLGPAAHWAAIAPPSLARAFLPKLGLMFALYALGFAFYVSRWPERARPGRFDLFGASHQLWHLCVLLAALAWLSNLDDFMAQLHSGARPLRDCAKLHRYDA